MAIAPDLLPAIHAPKTPAAPKPASGNGHGNNHGNGHGAPANGHGGEAHATPAAATPDWQGRFAKDALFHIDGSGAQLDRRNRPTGEQEQSHVTFSEPLRRQYRTFLDRYVTKLQDIQQHHPNALTGPLHAHDRELLRILGHHDGHPLQPGQREAQLNDFLSSAKNWEITTLAMEQHMSRILYSLGIKAMINPAAEKITQAGTGRIRLGIDRGILRQVWDEQVQPFMTQRIDLVGGRPNPNSLVAGWNRWQALVPSALGTGSTAIMGALIGTRFGSGPLGLALGAALPPTAMALHHMGREGVTIDLHRAKAVFDVIKTDPSEVAFMKEITGMNLDHYQAGPDGQIQLIPGNTHEIPVSPEQLKKEALSMMYTRMEFLQTGGVNFKDLDASVEQFLFFPPPGQNLQGLVEQTGFKGDIKVFHEFMNQGGHVYDAAGNVNVTESLQRWQQSRVNVLAREIHHEIEERLHHKERSDRVSTLQKRKGELEKAKTDAPTKATERKQNLETEVNLVKQEATSVRTYVTEARKWQAKQAQNRIDRQREEAEARATIRDAGGAAYTTTPDALNGLYAVLSQRTVGGVTPTVQVNNRTYTSLADREHVARDALTNPPLPTVGGGVQVKDIDFERKSRLDAYNAEMQRIEQDRTKLNEAIAKLEGAQRRDRENIPSTLEEGSEIERVALQSTNRMARDFDAITGIDTALIAAMGLPAGVGLNELALRTQTVDQLMQLINTAHTRLNTVGWPAAENANRRASIIHAMAEARAREASPYLSAPQPLLDQLTARPPAGWDISERQLLTMTSQDIYTLLNEKVATNPIFAALPAAIGMPLVHGIENIRTIALERLAARERGLQETEEFMQQQIDRLPKNPDTNNIDALIRQVGIAEQLLANEGDIFAKIEAIEHQPERYLNATPVDPADTRVHTNAERATYNHTPAGGAAVARQYSEGYLEMMNLMFDYQNPDKGDRDRLFQQYSQLVTPDQLGHYFNEHIVQHVPVPAGGPLAPLPANLNDIDVIFPRVHALLQGGQISWINLQEAMEHIIDRLAEEARIAQPA